MQLSIFYFIRLFTPRIKGSLRLGMQDILHRFITLRRLQFQFSVYERIVKIHSCSIVLCSSVIYFVNMRPIYRPKTHGARFTRSIQHTTAQVESAQFDTSSPYGIDLGMRCGVIVGHNPIHSCCHHPTIFYNHSPERTTSILHIPNSQSYRLTHKIIMSHCS